MNLKNLYIAALGALLPGAAAASELVYTPSSLDSEVTFAGTGKAETYNVAVRLADPNLKGMKVRSISVAFPEGVSAQDVSGWLTSRLSVQFVKGKRQNVVDIISIPAEVKDGILTVDFGGDYEVPEEGIYAGYSFTVPDTEGANAAPLAVTSGVVPEGLFIYSSMRYLDWADRSSEIGAATALKVTLEGNVAANSLALAVPELHRYDFHKDFNLPVTLKSHASDAIASFEYAYSAGGREGKGTYTFPSPLKLQWGRTAEIALPIEGISAKGADDFRIEIAKVNGAPNADLLKAAEGKIQGYFTVPVNRPLVEEYTGLWCGYCPRGLAGMEHMNNEFPDEFVCVSIHDKDAMTIFERKDMPAKNNSTFPAAWINRSTITDPYFGSNESGTANAAPFGFDREWEKVRSEFTPVDVDVYAWWDQEDPALVHVRSYTRFVEPQTRKFRLGYYFTQDSMEDENWIQFNYMSGWAQMEGIEEMTKYVEGEPYIQVFFDDVALINSDIRGVEGSLPAEIAEDRLYTHDYEFRTTDAKNLNDTPIFQTEADSKVVVYVIQEGKGIVLNSDKCEVSDTPPDPSGVEETAAEAKVVSSEYYTLDGIRVREPQRGIYIRVDHLGNGMRSTSKVVY